MKILYLSAICVYVHQIWLYLPITRLSADIEENPGPKRNSDQSFFIWHCILTVLPSRTILKYVFLLRDYILLDTFDVVCISETHLDYTTSLDDNNLEIARCNLSDHTSTARELVFVYIKKGHLLWLHLHFISLYRSSILNVNPLILLKNFQIIYKYQ